jgi:hypothetical protein
MAGFRATASSMVVVAVIDSGSALFMLASAPDDNMAEGMPMHLCAAANSIGL